MKSLSQVRKDLKSLYSGGDTTFGQLSCPNCNNFPLDPLECQGCQNPICKVCLLENNEANFCKACNAQAKDLRPVHPFLAKAYRDATFKCPNKCGKNKIKLEALLQHINDECDLRPIECPLAGCSEKFNKYQIMQHKSVCKFKNVRCSVCFEQMTKQEHDCLKVFAKRLKEDTVNKQLFFS